MKDKIKETEWQADWSGPFPILDVSSASDVYFDAIQDLFGKSFSSFLLIYKEGISSAWLPVKEYKELGKYLAEKAKDIEYVKKWAKDLKGIANKIISETRATPKDFYKKLSSLRDLYSKYGGYQVATKIVFDFLRPEEDREAKNLLEETRKYSETFYKNSGELFGQIAEIIARENPPYTKKLILVLTAKELRTYLSTKALPEKELLEKRYSYSGIYWNKNDTYFLNESEVKEIESFWVGTAGKKTFTGVSAFKGIVRGRCRIIQNYAGATINEGEILVTGMTDPQFLPLIKKAAAIVTDGGGLLSHAAIVAREFKKPTIIGTKIATQVLKDSDFIEVDADKGIVEIL